MIQKYIDYIRNVRGLSEHTARSYRKDMQHFIAWARINISGARWSTITTADIDRYISQQSVAGLKPATTNRRLAAISGFYQFLKRQGIEITNPCKYESRRKLAQRIPNTIPTADLRLAYASARGVSRVLLGLLSTTGMRIGEVLQMQWHNIDFNECTIKIWGKGAKQRVVYTTPEALQELQEVKRYTKHDGYVFRIAPRVARQMVADALRPYTDAPQVSPHAIRHTFATNLANEGVNVSTIGALLGHNHLSTTQKYIDSSQAPCREAAHNNSLI